MTYSGDSPAMGAAQIDPQKWVAAIALDNAGEAQAIVNAYETFAPQVGLDPDLALAQGALESAWFSSVAWTTRHNPAGLGITGDNVAGPQFGSVDRGVQAHLALLNCYFGNGSDPWGVLTSVGFGGFTKGFTKLSQMDGVWAVPGVGYGQHIADIANSVAGNAPPVDRGVYGEDLVSVLLPHIGESNSWGNALDPWNKAYYPDHQWAGWCESMAEGAQFAAGLTGVVHRASAADKLDAVTSQGLLQTSWPPEDGAVCLWGRSFDPEGHTTVWSAAKGMWISTLYNPSRIDYYYSDSWKAQMAGWYRAPGVVAANRSQPKPIPTPPQTPFFADGNPHGAVPIKDLFWARWDALNTMGKVMAYPGQINADGLALPTLGYPVEPDKILPTGRRVQKYERGWLAYQGDAAPFDVVQLLLSEIPA